MTIKKGEQLALFHTATDLMSRPLHEEVRVPGESTAQFWSRKEAESRTPYGAVDPHEEGESMPGSGVYDSIKQRGFTSSIKMEDTGEIADGYHRVAAAARLEKETGQPMHLPVMHGPATVDDSTARWGFAPVEERHWPQRHDSKWFK